MEEIYLEGPLGNTDVRIINSYPSKVMSTRVWKKSKVQKSESIPSIGLTDTHVSSPKVRVHPFNRIN